MVSTGENVPLPVPIVAALVLTLFVYTVSSISGTHLNPAVSIGLFSIKKISLSQLLWYILAQMLGAELAYFATLFFIDKTPTLTISNTLVTGVAEAIGTFVLAFGVAAVVYKKVPEAASGFVIGGSLLLGIALAGAEANGILNPAVALSIGSLGVMYILGPIVGGVFGMWTFKLLSGQK